MGSRQSKTVVTKKAQTPETISFREVKYSIAEKGYRENFRDTRKEISRIFKTQNTEQHTNE